MEKETVPCTVNNTFKIDVLKQIILLIQICFVVKCTVNHLT